MFRVGQKVVCVDDGPHPMREVRWNCMPIPQKIISAGEIYTVRGVLEHPISRTLCVYLVEVTRPDCFVIKVEPPFAASRFRPVQEKGMEMLRAILVHPKSPVKEDA